ncbi:MAG TPA: DUF2585 family protein [Pyrinomonadaceae bacterium]|nr:DUF2585 family protein [Pyrinomonadaceae bacterium]
MSENTEPMFGKYQSIAIFAIIAVAVVVLNWQGRVLWCQQGDYLPWAWNIWSPHNSQHILDPYTFTHILHGVLEFWLIGLVFWKMPMAWRLVLAVFIESTWEVAENSSYIINRYREETISLDYFGDSIINSLADIVACACGFLIAYKLRFWKSLAFFVATELILLFTIKDSLIVNIIMLLFPIQAIKDWQLPVQ